MQRFRLIALLLVLASGIFLSIQQVSSRVAAQPPRSGDEPERDWNRAQMFRESPSNASTPIARFAGEVRDRRNDDVERLLRQMQGLNEEITRKRQELRALESELWQAHRLLGELIGSSNSMTPRPEPDGRPSSNREPLPTAPEEVPLLPNDPSLLTPPRYEPITSPDRPGGGPRHNQTNEHNPTPPPGPELTLPEAVDPFRLETIPDLPPQSNQTDDSSSPKLDKDPSPSPFDLPLSTDEPPTSSTLDRDQQPRPSS